MFECRRVPNRQYRAIGAIGLFKRIVFGMALENTRKCLASFASTHLESEMR
jgi:hypothetical protein